jgi:ABC-2 type transport system ATP-binding protein
MSDGKEKRVEVRDLKKHFGHIEAVRGVSFEVAKGEVLGFLGPNGAGKSTTMRMITGFLPPSSGTALVGGHDIITDPIRAKQQMGYLPENAPGYGSMTVTNFLKFTGSIRGYRGSELEDRVNAAIKQCSLQSVATQTINTLSKGYRQRSCFAQAILHDPAVLIMDEPTDGLDPNQKHVVREMIERMASEKAIIISTHILEEVEAVCTRAIIIAQGKIVANDSPDALKAKSSSGRLDEVFRTLTLEKEA